MVPHDSTVPVGPPAPHLDNNPALQWRLSARPAWRDFQANWPGNWAARWDPRNGTPRFLWAPGIPVSDGEALVDDVARLAGVSPSELNASFNRVDLRTDRQTILQWTRTWNGVPVTGDEVSLVVKQGRIAGIWVRLTPIHLSLTPMGDEVVFPVPNGDRVRPTLATLSMEDSHVVVTDRAGDEVYRYETRYFDSVQISHEERTIDDEMVEDPGRELTVIDEAGDEDITDDNGDHDLTGELTVALDGPSLTVYQDGSDIEESGTDDITLTGGDEITYAAAAVAHHFHVTWDWLEALWPDHKWLDANVPADVGVLSGTCNAYYTSGQIVFYGSHPTRCNEFGRIADVIYHELGHGIHHYILGSGTFASDVSEGSADYVSATLLDDPELAPNAYVDGSYIREIETDKVYPDDVIGESHNDGLIWASFLWNLREQWIEEYGDDEGLEFTDTLLLSALEQGPTLTSLYEAVILADDDDGDLSNGTPHTCELVELLDQHGLGPGPVGVVVFDHDPLGPQDSNAQSYDIEFDLYSVTEGCDDLDLDSVKLWYTIGDAALPSTDTSEESDAPEEPDPSDTASSDTGISDTGMGSADSGFAAIGRFAMKVFRWALPPSSASSDSGGGSEPVSEEYEDWTSLTLARTDNTFVGSIARQPAGSQIRYFIEAASTDGSQVVASHNDLEEYVYSFWVGDRHPLHCEDFETGASAWEHGVGLPDGSFLEDSFVDDWECGEPAGDGLWSPDVASEGSAVCATNLAGDYSASTIQHFTSPEYNLNQLGPLVLLTFDRWLSVEDGLYDIASVWGNGTNIYENPSSPDASLALIDGGWTAQELDIRDLVTLNRTAQASFILMSDSGIEFGGWAIDNFCVEVLDDLEGHYMAGGLNATDDADEVTISWDQPWVTPLAATVLVRGDDTFPDNEESGTIIHVDWNPMPGEPMSVVDESAVPGEQYYYILYAAQDATNESEDWYTDEIMEGENADIGGIPLDEPIDSGTTDTGSPDSGDTDAPDTDEGSENEAIFNTPLIQLSTTKTTCGCAGAPRHQNMGWIALLAACVGFATRRRHG